MPIRIIYAEPGPEAEAAYRRGWELAYRLADERIARQLEREATKVQFVRVPTKAKASKAKAG